MMFRAPGVHTGRVPTLFKRPPGATDAAESKANDEAGVSLLELLNGKDTDKLHAMDIIAAVTCSKLYETWESFESVQAPVTKLMKVCGEASS